MLTPHADVGPESELQAMAPDGVRIHAARVPFGAMASGGAVTRPISLDSVRAFAGPPHVDDATRLLAAAPLRSIAFGFTSSGYALGSDGETEMIARLEQLSRGIPVVTTCSSAVLGLRALDVRRVALFDPPWFGAELSALGAGFFRDQGFDVVYSQPCGLPSDQRSITPEALFDWVVGHLPGNAEAVFVGGNGFRAAGVIGALEQELDRPVLTANQVLLWHALAAGGVHAPVAGYGRLYYVTPYGL